MTTRSQRTAVATAGLSIANIGIAIPWGGVDGASGLFAGANPVEWLLNVTFVVLALALAVGWLTPPRLLRGAALASAGAWTATGWHLWLTSEAALREISLGVVCWGIAAMALSIDYAATREADR